MLLPPVLKKTWILYAGNKLIISSNQQAIKSVIVRGNLTAASVSNRTYSSQNVAT